MQKELLICGEKVFVTRKKMKNIRLSISANGDVKLSAPTFVPLKQLENFVEEKMDWIKTQKLKLQTKTNKFQSGEVICVLGKPYVLEVIKSNKNAVKFFENNLFIYTNTQSSPKDVFFSWAKKYLKKILPTYFQKWSLATGLQVKGFSIRNMKTRWGSCNYKKQTISINVQIIFKDLECLDYLVLHEIAHIKEPSHNQNFKNFLTKYMKNWKIIRKKLKNN